MRGLASAAVDVSDGLIADLGHIADASGVQIEVDAEAHPALRRLARFLGRRREAPLSRAATAGDDYQIAFTAAPARETDIMAAAQDADTAVTRIGSVTAGEGVALAPWRPGAGRSPARLPAFLRPAFINHFANPVLRALGGHAPLLIAIAACLACRRWPALRRRRRPPRAAARHQCRDALSDRAAD